MRYCQFCSCFKCIKERAKEREEQRAAERDKDKWQFPAAKEQKHSG